MSLHHLHAPQADMLECKLEILINYSSSEKPAHWNMQPHKWRSVQWCTGKWHLYGGCIVEQLATWYLAGGVWAICIKPVLSYICKSFWICKIIMGRHTM